MEISKNQYPLNEQFDIISKNIPPFMLGYMFAKATYYTSIGGYCTNQTISIYTEWCTKIDANYFSFNDHSLRFVLLYMILFGINSFFLLILIESKYIIH